MAVKIELQKEEGQMTFVMAGDQKMIIDHTEIYTGNEGKGYGKMLVVEAVSMQERTILKFYHCALLLKKYLIKHLNIMMYYSNGKFIRKKH